MATASDIAEVRRNTDEPKDDTYSDTDLAEYVDSNGVAGASAKVWREKAGTWASLVTTSEAGASHAYSDLSKNAAAMAKMWEGVDAGSTSTVPDAPRVSVIERTS